MALLEAFKLPLSYKIMRHIYILVIMLSFVFTTCIVCEFYFLLNFFCEFAEVDWNLQRSIGRVFLQISGWLASGRLAKAFIRGWRRYLG